LRRIENFRESLEKKRNGRFRSTRDTKDASHLNIAFLFSRPIAAIKRIFFYWLSIRFKNTRNAPNDNQEYYSSL